MENLLFGAAACLYAAAAALHVIFLLRLRDGTGRAAWILGTVGAGLHGLALAGVAMTDGASALLGPRLIPAEGALGLALAATAVGVRGRFWVTGAFAAPVLATVLTMTVLGCAFVPRAPSGAGMGALSPIHITASVLGFLSFVLAYVIAALYVLQDARLRTKTPAGRLRLPPLQTLEQTTYRVLFVGFVLYSIGAVLGTVWAVRGEDAAGFRPQYPVAILSWAVFAVVLGLRFVTGWSGRRAAMLLALGFVANLAVVLCYYMRAA